LYIFKDYELDCNPVLNELHAKHSQGPTEVIGFEIQFFEALLSLS